MNKYRLASMFSAVVASLALAACATTETQRSAGEAVDDASITARVKAELIDNDTTKARQIEVETYRGVVQLNGFVDSQTERDTATRVARSVNGVTEVHNNLQIKQSVANDSDRTAGETVDDASLTAKVKAALVDNPTTAARRINVTTYSGVVQLSGFVNSDDEKTQAAKVAQGVEGVRQVRNELEVKPAP
jgi:hyperosmotically inducible protein